MPKFAGGEASYQAAIKSGKQIVHNKQLRQIDAGQMGRHKFCGFQRSPHPPGPVKLGEQIHLAIDRLRSL